MKQQGLWVVAGLVVVGLVAGFFLMRSQAPSAEGGASRQGSSTVVATVPGAADLSSATAARPSAAVVQSAREALRPEGATSEVAAPVPQDSKDVTFRTDSSGRLITDEQARLNIEKLVALNDPQDVPRKVQELAQTLPPAAAQQLPDLVDRYRNYDAALRQAVPPAQAPSSAQDAITMLETMHALRVQHFGKEVAEGFFATEEKAQRQMIELMRLDSDQSLTLQEKAEKAQALYESMPQPKEKQERR